MANHVRVNSTYFYVPVPLDRIHPPYNAKHGDVLRVVNLPGCPKANTMGHCHVQHQDGTFAGLVCAGSLLTTAEYREYLEGEIAQHEVNV
jgi:hypothetical protein